MATHKCNSCGVLNGIDPCPFCGGGERLLIDKPGEYRMRDGRKAVVLTTDAPDPDFPVVGYIVYSATEPTMDQDEVMPDNWQADGSYVHPSEGAAECGWDIVEKWGER